MKFVVSLLAFGMTFALGAAESTPLPSGPQTDGKFKKVILDADKDSNGDGTIDDTLADPLELTVAPDGRVFFGERNGAIKMWKPDNQQTVTIAKLNVFTEHENGLLGITLDPNFSKNNFVYVFYSTKEVTKDANGQKAGVNRISRFNLVGDQLNLASEKALLDVASQRETCCHHGGSLTFDAQGNLLASTGDNTNPFESDGYSPLDERPGRSPWDGQRAPGNANDLRGKILRITPQPDGSIKIPAGNLFPPGTPGTRPEIFVMGCRNPYRISVDQRSGFVYWGDVGPDAGAVKEGRGPAGYDEVNRTKAAGFFGWPYFIGDNRPYFDYDFATKVSGTAFNPEKPINNSIYNTGITNLPPAQPAWIYYPGSHSTRFPKLNGPGGRTAMAGPVYYFDEKQKSDRKLPREYDHVAFIYEWSRNWITAVYLDKNENIASMERFCPNMTFKRPMDIELGPDGCLYVLEYGTAWGNNKDTQIVRIDFVP